jgi:hypothetical protein
MFVVFAILIGGLMLVGAFALGFVMLKAAKPVKRVKKSRAYELDD